MEKIIPVYGALVMYQAANLQTVKQELFSLSFYQWRNSDSKQERKKEKEMEQREKEEMKEWKDEKTCS